MLELFRYRLPMTGPTTAGGEAIREGMLIQIQYGEQVFYGDIAPLPGLHTNSLDTHFLELRRVWSHKEHSLGLVNWLQKPDLQLDEFWRSFAERWPTISFGLHSLKASMHNYSTAVWPFNRPPEKRKIAGLLNPGDGQVGSNLTGTWKIKIGRGDSQIEQELVRQLLKHAPDRRDQRHPLRLRLDANQNLGLNQINSWLDILNHTAVELIEEPFQSAKEYKSFASQYPNLTEKIAFDESLNSPWWPEFATELYSKAFVVVKPSLLGWSRACRLLLQYGPKAIVSSVFESGIGLNTLAGMGHHETPAGIGTYRWFIQDLLTKPAVQGQHWSFQFHPEVDAGRLVRLVI